jgi:hypothetical protein
MTPAVIETQGKIKLYQNGLIFDPKISFAEWESKGKEFTHVIRIMTEHIRWWLGDWIIFGEDKFKDKYSQALEAEMYSVGTLRNIVWVCRNVPLEVRNANLSFDHHYEVAKLVTAKQKSMLAQADANKWTVKQLRCAVRGDPIPESGRCVPGTLPDRLEDVVANVLSLQIQGGFATVAEETDERFLEWIKDNQKKLSQQADEQDAYRMVWRAAIKQTVESTIKAVKKERSHG